MSRWTDACCRVFKLLPRWGTLPLLVALLAGTALFAKTMAAEPKRDGPERDGPAVAGEVHQALQAELRGDNERRSQWLEQALTREPDDAAARWHSGQVQVGDQWLSLQDVQEQAAEDKRLARYQAFRDLAAAHDKMQAHRALARWCRRTGLEQRARLHWLLVLEYQPEDPEALRALELRNFEGRLMTREQIGELEDARRQYEEFVETWEPRLTAWRDALEGDDPAAERAARSKLNEVEDPRLFPLLEKIFSMHGEQHGLTVVALLSGLDHPAATESLARHALACEFPAVRQAAAESLRSRPPHDYMPRLLNQLAAPLELTYYVSTYNNDGAYRVELFREKPTAARRHSEQGQWHTRRVNHFMRRGYSADLGLLDSARLAERALQRIRRLNRQVTAENRRSAAWNERVYAALKTAAGQPLPDEPAAWWKWWQEFNELSGSDEKPTYTTGSHWSTYYSSERVNYSCFVPGTRVWTETGPRPIESIRVGDRVLSQDPDTGELAYKLVLDTTLRPPSPTLRLQVGGEEIRTTLGHPFWVNGQGWRMAKQLSTTSRLHGVRGAVAIDAIDPGPETEAHNLVVADFNTYFVGSAQVLVHDNVARRPTRAIVPGLLRELKRVDAADAGAGSSEE